MEPGTLPRASRNSRTSAIRIEVSCRQPHLSQSASPSVPLAGSRFLGPLLVRLGGRLERVRLRRPHIGHECITWARMSVSSCWVAVPNTAPAMCPVRSITSVVGVPAIGTTAVKSSVITEPESLTLG